MKQKPHSRRLQQCDLQGNWPARDCHQEQLLYPCKLRLSRKMEGLGEDSSEDRYCFSSKLRQPYRFSSLSPQLSCPLFLSSPWDFSRTSGKGESLRGQNRVGTRSPLEQNE